MAEGAPAPAAAFLTVVPKIAAAVALARFVALFPQADSLRLLVAVLSAATMTLGNLAAFWQDDVRRLIGWSSVAQAGYALMAVAVAGVVPRRRPHSSRSWPPMPQPTSRPSPWSRICAGAPRCRTIAG